MAAFAARGECALMEIKARRTLAFLTDGLSDCSGRRLLGVFRTR
jgi:hypothetical protein